MMKQRMRASHRWLLLIPFVWQVALAPLVNDVALRPFALPFAMFWQMAGIVLTTIVIAVVLRIDRRRDALADPAHPPDPDA